MSVIIRAAFAASLGAVAAASAPPRDRQPSWTNQRPHFVEHAGERYATAVGHARRVDNLPLARAVAEDRARADLARLLEGRAPAADVSAPLPGARLTDSYTVKRDGEVYVRMEVPAPRRR